MGPALGNVALNTNEYSLKKTLGLHRKPNLSPRAGARLPTPSAGLAIGTCLVHIDGTLNSAHYISGVLRPVALPFIRALRNPTFQKDIALLYVGGCKEPLPAPGNRSNERRYKEKDLARTEEKKVGTGEKREGDEKSRGREK
ncbi:hypothetical protein TNCV_2039261 [Trichonephila clavipes]|nr:hypothetical protein TNCV_2039261 [Trichonephila clavipes]